MVKGWETKNEWELRKDIIEVCKRMYAKGFIASSDGNVSIKTAGGRIILTPGGLNKGFITPEDLVVTDLDGVKISGKRNPSSEIRMHVRAYKLRPDIKAIVHAHPPICVAFSIAGESLAHCILPEVVLSLGTIPTSRYATPTTEETSTAIDDFIKEHDALILDRHGTVTVGKDVYEAYNKLERIEHAAQITLAARQLGRINPLPRDEVEKLATIAKSYGFRPAGIFSCRDCGVCRDGAGPGESHSASGCNGSCNGQGGLSEKEIDQVAEKVIAEMNR